MGSQRSRWSGRSPSAPHPAPWRPMSEKCPSSCPHARSDAGGGVRRGSAPSSFRTAWWSRPATGPATRSDEHPDDDLDRSAPCPCRSTRPRPGLGTPAPGLEALVLHGDVHRTARGGGDRGGSTPCTPSSAPTARGAGDRSRPGVTTSTCTAPCASAPTTTASAASASCAPARPARRGSRLRHARLRRRGAATKTSRHTSRRTRTGTGSRLSWASETSWSSFTARPEGAGAPGTAAAPRCDPSLPSDADRSRLRP